MPPTPVKVAPEQPHRAPAPGRWWSRPMSRIWLVCSKLEALPEGERQRFKRNRAIQLRAAEENKRAPESLGGA